MDSREISEWMALSMIENEDREHAKLAAKAERSMRQIKRGGQRGNSRRTSRTD
jgi:hypothetical protein